MSVIRSADEASYDFHSTFLAVGAAVENRHQLARDASVLYRQGLSTEQGQLAAISVASVLGGVAAKRALGGKGAVETAVPKIGGRLPINSKHAGQVHPSGVRFTEQGFPDFRPYSKAEVGLEGLTGVYRVDERLANAAVGLKSTPKGFIWHHVEDGFTMQLIPKSTHSSVRHTGGAAVIRNGGFD